MVEIERKTVKLSQIRLNPNNPRRISTKDMDRLVKSLQEFPDMLNIREVVVDETMTVLGGNMRTLALKKIGAKDCVAKIVTGLTPEQKREFIVKDNAAFGEWDMDALSSWDDLPLIDWGVKLPEDWKAAGEEKQPRDQRLDDMQYQIIIECADEHDQKNLLSRFDKEGLKCRALIL
jgi:hypothetical protein